MKWEVRSGEQRVSDQGRGHRDAEEQFGFQHIQSSIAMRWMASFDHARFLTCHVLKPSVLGQTDGDRL